MRRLLLVFLLLASLSFADFYISEGGNVTSLGLNGTDRTIYWAGITGWMNTSAPSNPNASIGYASVGVSDINHIYINGTWYGGPMVATRLDFKPELGYVRPPTLADISSGGMFDNFTLFNGMDFLAFVDSPFFTYVAALNSTVTLNQQTFTCAQITLVGPTPLCLLVYDNGTHQEPLFIANVGPMPGYNGTLFDFQYMAPVMDNYFFYVYPPPPNVTIISPRPVNYNTYNIPLTYNITSYYPLDSCWYIIDGHRVGLPDCNTSPTLNLMNGTHILYLYANDSAGQISWDSVIFSIGIIIPPYIPGGPGGPHIPQPAEPEIPPVIPPGEDYFSVNPEDIRITIDYPWAGGSPFFLFSKYSMVGVDCTVSGGFAQYSTVELASDEIGAGGTIDGKITVEIPPEILIDYRGGTEGTLQCSGRSTVNSSRMLWTFANVHLKINTPLVTVENITVENVTVGIYPGQALNQSIPLNNTGAGNSSTYLMTFMFEGENSKLISVVRNPGMIGHWQAGILGILIEAPHDFPVGTYEIPLVVYENGIPIGRGYVTLKVKEGRPPPEEACAFPVFLNWFVFYESFPTWVFLLLLATANYALLKWRKRHTWPRRLLTAAAPILLSLPGAWVFAPCFMMNVAVAQFILTFLWKFFRGKEREEIYEGRKQKKKPFKSEEIAEEERDKKMAKEEEK